MKETPGPSLASATPVLPTLALRQLVATAGDYPADDEEWRAWLASNLSFRTPPEFVVAACRTLGMIQTFAGASAYGAPRARGQQFPISQNTALFSLYGANYGGDWKTTCTLPDFRGRTAVGGFPGEKGEKTLAMSYMILALGSATGSEPPVGSVGLFGGKSAPAGWLACDGSQFRADDLPELAAVIGTTFGGDDWDIAVPNLIGRAAYGVEVGSGAEPITLGRLVDGAVPGLGLNYIICTKGLYPAPDGVGEFPSEPFLGHVTAYAGAQAPAGWALCDGAVLSTEYYRELFSLLGATYGGDGIEAFALPDLRGRVTVGD